jgi:hypothetical protein
MQPIGSIERVGIAHLTSVADALYWTEPAGLMTLEGDGPPRQLAPPLAGPLVVAGRTAYQLTDLQTGRLEALRDGAWAPAATLGPCSDVSLTSAGAQVVATLQTNRHAGSVHHIVTCRFAASGASVHEVWRQPSTRCLTAADDATVLVVWEETTSVAPLPPPPGAYHAERVSRTWWYTTMDHRGEAQRQTRLTIHPGVASTVQADGDGALVNTTEGIWRVSHAQATRVVDAEYVDGFAASSSWIVWNVEGRLYRSWRDGREPTVIFETPHLIRALARCGSGVAVLVDPETDVVLAALGKSLAPRQLLVLEIG